MFTASSTSDDEFSAYNLSEFTEEDFKRVDADVARISQGGPQITIQVEAPGGSTITSHTSDVSKSRAKGKQRADLNPLSPMARYRKNGVLSVTDLASLAWCEVQFDYGLRQRRHMPIAMRPQSFISAQGKEISVAKEVAVKNDERTKQGKALHKVLEREVKAEEVSVKISSKEEQLVNMLASLDGILLEGYTREFPVFGILQGEVVVGIIDEVVLKTEFPTTPQKRPSSSPPRSKSKKLRRSNPPSQNLVTEYFLKTTPIDPSAPIVVNVPPAPIELEIEKLSAPIKPSPAPTSPLRKFLRLFDTKTRKKNSLPADRDTLPSRIQLMIYYRLLKDLTSLSPPFDFAAMWQRVGVDPVQTFSTKFLTQAGLLEEINALNISCLNDLSNVYVEMVQSLDIVGVDTKLELLYRLRQSKKDGGKKSGRASKKRSASPVVSQEERDLAKAIEASLIDIRASGEPAVQGNSSDGTVQLDPVQSADAPSDAGTPTVDLENPLEHLNVTTSGLEDKSSTPRFASLSGSSDTEVETDKYDLRPIGIKSFDYDEEMLDCHIADVLKWWHGDRNPQGVSLEDSQRCRTCEYESNCEWREQKALELQKPPLKHR